MKGDHFLATFLLLPAFTRHSTTSSAVLSVLLTLFVLPFVMMDFDLHHDGLLLAQAIAVKEGLVVHSEVFSSYGPISPWTQSVFLLLPVSGAAALRIWSLFHIALATFLLADLARFAPPRLKKKPWVFWAGPIAWVITADFLQQGNFLPWSSLQAAAMLMAAMYLFLLANNFEKKNLRFSHLAALSAGFVVGLLPFARINVGVPLVLLLLICVFMDRKALLLSRGSYKALTVGVLLGISTILGILMQLGALSSYWMQSVLYPLGWATESARWTDLTGLVGIWAWMTIPVGIFFLGMATSGEPSRNARRRGGLPRLRWIHSLVFGIPITISSAAFAVLSRDGMLSGSHAALEVIATFVLGNQNVLYLGVTMLIALWGFIVFKKLFKRQSESGLSEYRLAISVSIFSVAGFGQIIPTFDSRHVWWGSSPVWLAIILTIVSSPSLRNRGLHLLAAIGLLHLPLIALGVADNINDPRMDSNPGSLTFGIQLRPETKTALLELNQLQSIIPQDDSVVVVSADGIASIIDGKFRGAEPYFVTWAPGAEQLAAAIEDVDWVLAQDRGLRQLGYVSAEAFSESLNLQRLECGEKYCLFQRR